MNAPTSLTSFELLQEAVESVLDESAVSAPPTVRIECRHATRLNLADFQNAVPLIRELVLINDGQDDLPKMQPEYCVMSKQT